MRPKITSCKSVARSLRYNEEKIALGKAECLTAANFIEDRDHLSFEEKLHRFEKRMELNERVSTSLHITLNFDPTDKLSNEQMQGIAKMYMNDIGFGRQPYLVYRHYDAGHPHLHIVTTHVRSDGNPIDLYNIGCTRSEQARQHIEEEYRLVTAEMKAEQWQGEKLGRQEEERLGWHLQGTEGVREVVYGERSMARSVSEVLEYVTEQFNYTSLDELNLALRLYNVEAYRGREGSSLYENRGLLYRVLDERGQYVGRPLKASFFDCRPTLDRLEEKFVLNRSQRQEASKSLRLHVYYHLIGERANLEDVAEDLYRDEIRMRLRRDGEGKCSEVYYIDLRRRCVVRGDELDALCGREAIQRVIDREEALRQHQALHHEHTQRQRYGLHL